MKLRVEGLRKNLGSFNLDLSFETKEGEFLCVLGPSGCGKTTCLRIIAGILEPDSGSVFLNGNEITQTPTNRRNISMVFQNHALFPHMNVYENIAYGPKARGWDKKRIQETVERYLNLAKLKEFEDRRISGLSGGEQQRVALARALAVEPYLVLFDEPLSSLDANLKVELRREIRKMQRELAFTAVYVTHDQEEALALADRIVVMRDGGIAQTGSPQELYNKPESVFVGKFIGKSNIYPGIMGEVSGGFCKVATPIGQLAVYVGSSETKYSLGQNVQVFFRPEHVSIESDRQAQNSIKAEKVEIEYQGRSSLLEGEINGEKIFIETKNECLTSLDSSFLFIPPEKIALFRSPG